MARLGTKRATDALDYDRDIKGKGLIRLRAGVGAGKNYWVRHLPEKYPDLQILMITSRKNTAAAEAYRLGTDNKIHVSKLLDTDVKEWCKNYSGSLMVCTNAYIEHFFKKVYDADNPQTHLWNKFDVVFVDEVHSLTADAAFADSPFYVGRFIHHTRLLNPSCDVVLMSGTPEPTDWFFDGDFLSSAFTSIDLYDQCIHLVPQTVFLMNTASVPLYMKRLYLAGKRQIYFVNSVGRMADLITTLMTLNIPESALGIAYTESENAKKLPEVLVSNKEQLRTYLVENAKLPQEVKIFITTTQNKEGISIEDDDIKYMFSESRQKAELEQMAGRVRGNPETGTGLSTLIVVYDASQHSDNGNYIEREFDRTLIDSVQGILDEHEQHLKDNGKPYSIDKDIAEIHAHHRYIRYDYIGKEFLFYAAREQQDIQAKSDKATLDSYIALYDEVLCYCIDKDTGMTYAATGHSELNREWFPYSRVYMCTDRQVSVEEETLQEAATLLQSRLEENGLLNVRLDDVQKSRVNEILSELICRYGMSVLGLRNPKPKRLGSLFGRLGLTWESADHHSNDKIIHIQRPIETANAGS